MKYNVIELGDCTVGKASEIIKYLLDRKKEINTKELSEMGMDLDYFLKEDGEINNILLELKDYRGTSLIKLGINVYDELCWSEINI